MDVLAEPEVWARGRTLMIDDPRALFKILPARPPG
jgi:hypothetical protein